MQSMTYILVEWRHNLKDDPIILFSELDSSRREIRKVEEFSNGLKQYADNLSQTGDTRLADLPIPPISEIEKDVQFVPEEITEIEFNKVWNEATLAD